MISAEAFVERARARGFDFYAGVPCSYLTPFIDTVIADERLTWVCSASEGDAVAIASGAALGGRRAVVMMQNSGLGNAVNPLTSLSWPFRIPVLLIITRRGDPSTGDEPQHELMGRITTSILDQMQVPWAPFPAAESEIDAAIEHAMNVMQDTQRPFALIMQKGSVSPREPVGAPPPRPLAAADVAERIEHEAIDRPTRREALSRLVERTPTSSTVIIATTGYIGRTLYAVADRPNQLYMVGSMGCASALGLGLAMVRPDRRIVVADGDGAALMRLGNLATVGARGGANLVHLVLNNGVHETTGGQATTSPRLALAGVAAAGGYEIVLRGDDVRVVDELIAGRPRLGPAFAELLIRTGSPQRLPRPDLAPHRVRERFMEHLGSVPCAC